MQFRLLGPLELRRDDGTVVPLPRLRQRALLVVLLLRRGEPVSTGRLLEDIWGEHPPRTARESLQNAVSQLRKHLGGELLVTRPSGYALLAEREQIDLGQFELLTAQARATADPAVQAERLREALALWRGEPLGDVAFEPFAALEVPHLNGLKLNAEHGLIDAELSLGHEAEVLPRIETLVSEHPFDERLRCRLALALYRMGRQAAALDGCRDARRALDELGLDPSSELRSLEQQILRQDPVLDRPATPRVDAAPMRKTVTVVSAELTSFSRVAVDLDPEHLRALLGEYETAIRIATERHGGALAELSGDGFATAVFGLPRTHEDDALRAVRAANDARNALAGGLEGASAGSFGVTTGEVYADPDSPSAGGAAGVPFRAARRLAGAAPPGEIVLGGPTLRLVRPAVTVEPFEQTAEPELPAFRLLALVEGAPAFERRLDAPLVDRQYELGELRTLFEAASAGRCCRVATLLGEPGIGKTRLTAELANELGERAAVAVGRCVSYGEGVTYLPLADVVRSAGGDIDELLAGVQTTGEQFLAVRRFFESLARRRPLLLVFDDLQWAEPTLLDLIEYLGEHIEGVPVLILRVGRPDLLELRPGTRHPLRLAPLNADETETLLAGITAEVEPGLLARIVDRAEGNPLYAEHLLAYTLEGGPLDSLPPTLGALISDRLGRLPAEEQAALQWAAVVGQEFTRADLERLEPAGFDLPNSVLDSLTATGILRRGDAGRVRFGHGLVREAAYSRTPKARRAELHEAFAAGAVGADDSDELVGYHLEAAFRYGTELGWDAARTSGLAAEAARRLGSAGIRAWQRNDTPAAVNLLERAAALSAADDDRRLELLCELGVALRSAGEIGRAREVLMEAAAAAELLDDRRAACRAQLELANVRLFSSPGGRTGELLAAARAAIPVFTAAGDDRGLFRAWRLIAYAEGAMSCHYAASTEAATRALHHGRRSGWSTAACLGDLAAALYLGPTPVSSAIARCRRLMRDVDLAGQANVLVPLAGLEAMRGRFDEARAHVSRAEAIYAELGQTALVHATGGGVRGEIELLAGDAAAAEQAFRESLRALERAGDRANLSTRAVQLAEAAYRLGRNDEARRWSAIAEEGAAADDVPTQYLWRSIQAKLLAASGDPVTAERLAREAFALTEKTDALGQRAKVGLDLAEVLVSVGRRDDAATAANAALALYDEKGATVGAERARELLLGISAG